MDADGGGTITFKELNAQLRQGSSVKLAAEMAPGAVGRVDVAARNARARRPTPGRGKSPPRSPRGAATPGAATFILPQPAALGDSSTSLRGVDVYTTKICARAH